MSFSHKASEGRLTEIKSQYKVFRTGTAPGTFRQQNEHKDTEMRRCHNCDEQGHMARNCPNNIKKGQLKKEPVVQAVATGDLTRTQMMENSKMRKASC